MQAILLAAGKSSRFYPYNASVEHKSLSRLMGKTLLEHTVDALLKLGVENIIIVVGKNSQIPTLFSDVHDVTCTFVEQPEPLGMGDALLRAKEYLEEKFFLLGSYHMDIADFAHDMLALNEENQSVVLVKKDEVLNRYGNVTLHGDIVTGIIEKPEKVEKTGFRLLAIYLLTKTFIQELETIPTEEYHFEKALAAFAKKGNVKALVIEKSTVTLKYAWDLLGIKDYLLGRIEKKSISEKAFVAEDASISSRVIIEEGAKILEGVCIKEPAYIGKNVTIGNRTILRGGVIIEEGSVIGSQMEMKNTIVMENSTTHAGFIGDSVIGSKTKIAAGFITANARLDRQPVTTIVRDEKVNTGLRHLGTLIGSADNIGIRVSTMPGVIIGNNVIVGPSTTVMRNISDKKKYFTKFEEVVEENNEK